MLSTQSQSFIKTLSRLTFTTIKSSSYESFAKSPTSIHHYMSAILLVFLGMWLQLLFKVFFVSKCIKMNFFCFLKSIFEISASKRSKTQKKILIFNKKNLGNAVRFPNGVYITARQEIHIQRITLWLVQLAQ